MYMYTWLIKYIYIYIYIYTVCNLYKLYHHHILLSLLGHRASTKLRHLILFLASCLTSPQLFPCPNASLWTDLLHVCLGLPLFRCPCGLYKFYIYIYFISQVYMYI